MSISVEATKTGLVIFPIYPSILAKLAYYIWMISNFPHEETIMNYAKSNSKKVKWIKKNLVWTMLPNLNTGCCCSAVETDELQSLFSVLGKGKEKKNQFSKNHSDEMGKS